MKHVTRGIGAVRGIALAVVAAMALAGCTTPGAAFPPITDPTAAFPAPSTIADRTKVDEQAGLTVTLSYVAASRLAALSIRTGVVSDPATIRRIGEADNRAKAAVDAVRAAYLTANSDSYASALANARVAVGLLLDAVKGT